VLPHAAEMLPWAMMLLLMVVVALAACACSPANPAGVPEYGYEVVRVYPHDPTAFTEGLFYYNGFLYESTGLEGQSSIRKVKLETGEVVQKRDLSDAYFGEGIINWKDRLYELTWKTGIGFIYDFAGFAPKGDFHYTGEGWAMTQDGKRIIMDDGTPQLRFWNPETLQETGRLTVTDDDRPVANLNELEWVKGQIYANIWQTDRIARINPANGKVVGWIDCTGLLTPSESQNADVMNGIAYDAAGDRLFVTGKKWPKLFQIRLVRKSGAQ
jgi:glutaminyl-peptide cyclotransferase